MNSLALTTSSTEYVTGASLYAPNPPAQSLKELAAEQSLTLGLLVALDGGGFVEMRAPGYARQSAPGWTTTSMLDTSVSTADVEFGVSWAETRPARLMLYNDGEAIAGSEIAPGRAQPARPGQSKIVFPRGSISIRRW